MCILGSTHKYKYINVCVCAFPVYAFIALSLWIHVSLLTRATTYVHQIYHADLLFLLCWALRIFPSFCTQFKIEWINRRLCVASIDGTDMRVIDVYLTHVFFISFSHFCWRRCSLFSHILFAVDTFVTICVRVHVFGWPQRNITFDICLVINKQNMVSIA